MLQGRTGHRARGALLLVLVLAGAVHAGAQPLTGALRVYVPDVASGAVSVVAIDTANAARRYEAPVRNGVAALAHLVPSAYDVAVVVNGREVASGPVEIRAPWVAVVSATTVGQPGIALVDRYRVGDGVDFGERALRDLPGADNAWSLVETAAPFAIVDRIGTGGLGTGRSALAGGRGESWAMTAVDIDGLVVRTPTPTGALAFAGDATSASGVSVSSGLAPVDVESPGVVVGLALRRPGPEWHGAFDAAGTSSGMVGDNALPHAPSIGRIDAWRGLTASAGGPLSDRTGLVISAGAHGARFFERDAPVPHDASAASVSAHIVSSLSSSDQIRAMAWVERAAHPYDARRQFADRGVSSRASFARGQVSWNRALSSGGHVSAAVGHQRNAWRPDLGSDARGGTVDRVIDGAVPAPPADVTRTEWQARIDGGVAPRSWGRMTHEPRVGVTVRQTRAASETIALPVVAESVAALAARVWMPVAPAGPSSRTVTETAFHFSDRITLGPRLSVDAGARVDLVRGGAAGGAVGLAWTAFSPRVALRWQLGRLALFAGSGRYVGGDALSFLSFGDPGEVTWDVRRWVDVNGSGAFDDGEAGVVVARAGWGPSVASIDADLRAPRTTEWTGGAEVRLTRHATLRGALIVRRQSNVVGVENPGVPSSSYRRFDVPDIGGDEGSPADDQMLPIYERLPSSFGRDALVLTNPDAEPIAYDGIEVSYDLETPRWFMIFGATAYRAVGWGGAAGYDADGNDQLVLGDRFWNPNLLKDAYGRLFFDRAYVGKWSIGYHGPWGLRTAAVARYQDGQPFARYVLARDLATGPDVVQAYTMGRTRFTYTGTMDVRVEKGFSFGRVRASIRVDAFNVTNLANEVEEDVMTGPTFRLSTAVQPPRTLRLGVRVEF